jgi:hypothetical protein
MSNLITLTCPSYGGRLEVTNNTERYVCAHCGNAHIVDPGVRAESLAGEVEQVRLRMDIRQVEEDLSMLRKRQAELRTMLASYDRDQQTIKVVLITLPLLGAFAFIVYLAMQIDMAQLLLLLTLGVVLGGVWLFSSRNRYKAERREVARLKQRIASGQQTLNFLQQELKRASNGQ